MTSAAIMEIVDDAREFFAPVSSDVIDGLLGQYQQYRRHIDEIASIAAGDKGNAFRYFLTGNRDRASYMPDADRLFAPAGAIAALNSAYWSKAISLTDVYDAMPQARRDEWNKSITEMTAPEFTEDAVRPTIADLLASRQKFFGERVDGIFRGLSGDHVTNCPQGFSKRMILAYVTENGYHSTSRAGLINDLRAVIAKFMGRDEPKWNATNSVVSIARQRHGEWITLDGGAIRIRCYKIGTAHLEIHPEMSYRLNQVLAGMYPRAIPPEFRTKPKKKAKEFAMMGRPLPFAVLEVIRELRRERGTNSFMFGYGGQATELARAEAERVITSIGGVLRPRSSVIDFEYDPRDAMDEIIASGCIPDKVSHQYYPTPEAVARVAVEMADIGLADTVLEPSAGQGGIADYLPKDKTVCVEISKLHCDILRAKGFVTVQDDFISRSAILPKFDRVVMNPPFSDGRAQAHLLAAADLVKPSGRIVAVLPASFRAKDVLPGWTLTWSDVFTGEFAGTNVAVVILSGVRA